MRPFHPFAVALFVGLVTFTLAPTEEHRTAEDLPETSGVRHGRAASLKLDIADADLIQRTCALYVMVRSHAWKDQIGFGRDMDSAGVHWNTCPGGTMVACAVVPTANGDSVITGIPLH